MKNAFPFLFIFFYAVQFCFTQSEETVLKAPDNWRYEKLDFPLSFAPELELTGFEEVYFAPGWNNSEAEDFWTYAFAWVLETPIEFHQSTLENYLTTYYDGLMKVVGADGEVATKVSLTLRNNGYKGEVVTFDAFFTKKRLLLYLTIEKSPNPNIWIFRLSPNPWDHKNWTILDQVHIPK